MQTFLPIESVALPQRPVALLPSAVIDRIAAGEVLERPASAVKELVENAIDAGAQHIQVDIEEGGLQRIVVTDDGRGMSPEDARLCILRHATSKLVNADDLFNIRTLGFRGEALSSIASVSRMVITTRRPQDEAGFRIEVHGGDIVGESVVGCPIGTSIDVRDLFFNTPARRKFMKSPATEQAHVAESVLRVLLGARVGSVVLTAGERRLLDLPGDVPEKTRVLTALGGRAQQVYPFGTEQSGVRVMGYITKPEVDRSDAKGLWFFVNGRYVRDRMLQRAVLDGYRTLLDKGRYPTAVIYIDVSPQAVDVNVHPQKTEVRFSDASAVFRAVSQALGTVLARAPWLETAAMVRSTGSLEAKNAVDYKARVENATTRFFNSEAGTEPLTSYSPGSNSSGARPEPLPTHELSLGAMALGGISGLGQALSRYWLGTQRDELVVIDLQALAISVAWVQVRLTASALSTTAVKARSLILPEAIELTADVIKWIENHRELLLGCGVELDAIGPSRYLLRSVPEALEAMPKVALGTEIVRQLMTYTGDLNTLDASARAELLWTAAVRVGLHAIPPWQVSNGESGLVRTLSQLENDLSALVPRAALPQYRITLRLADMARLFKGA